MNKLIRYRYSNFKGTLEESVNKLFIRFGRQIAYPENLEEIKKYLKIGYISVELHLTISDHLKLGDLFFKNEVVFGHGDVQVVLNDDSKLKENKFEKIIASTERFNNVPCLSKTFLRKFSQIGVGYCGSIIVENIFLPDYAIQNNESGKPISEKSLVGFLFHEKKEKKSLFVPLKDGWKEEEVKIGNFDSFWI
jgi:hypothetical protein